VLVLAGSEAVTRIDLAAPLTQDRLEMVQCVVIAIECIDCFFASAIAAPLPGREDEIPGNASKIPRARAASVAVI